MTRLRPTAVAGVFYPDQPRRLADEVDRLLAEAGLRDPLDPALSAPSPAWQGDEASDLPLRAGPVPAPKAIIAPHAGYPYSGSLAARAHAALAPLAGRVRRVILLGPSHRVPFHGLALTEADAYATPFGPVPLDRPWMARLAGLPWVGRLEEAHGQEHALEVHLPFLMRVLGSFGLVPIVCGRAAPTQVAEALDRLWGGSETVIVVSSDLSHYRSYSECQDLDAATARAIEALDPTPIGPQDACGHVALAGLLALAGQKGLRIDRVGLWNSGDTAGGRDRVVGYGAWSLWEPTRPAASAA